MRRFLHGRILRARYTWPQNAAIIRLIIKEELPMLERVYDSLNGVGVPDIVCKAICFLVLVVPILGLMYLGLPLLPKAQYQASANRETSVSSEAADYVETRKLEAFVQAKAHVAKQLKAPATAEFPPASTTFVTAVRAGEYRVAAYVDSQNSFGAKIRTSYVCDLEYADKRWVLKNLNLSQ
jgi:hypothetical protein